ncbi:MAG: hypothetical protein EXS37_07035 [Opitutus sp.]|nr:hypothetical protein [Opitutus sp.]
MMIPSIWKAGVAAMGITPAESMWLAGWAARRQASAGTSAELFAKALALEDAAGERAVIVTADLIAIPRTLATAVAARVQWSWNLPRERLLFNASHTHTGPEIRPDKVPFFEIPPEFAAKIAPYVARLEETLVNVIGTALERLEPVTLRVQQLRTDFAVNRRSPSGPTDHDVPMLAVCRADESPLAIVFGYACHNLTLPPTFREYHGDYAGVAQAGVEKMFPGVTAVFLAGAGADQDPAPRGTLELTRAHGQTLADEIQNGWSRGGRTITGALRVAFEEIALDLQPRPTLENLQADLRSDDPPRRRKAAYLLAALTEQRPLPTSQTAPNQVLRLGDELLLIALGGEPVADYALRFKQELAGPVVWVAGYCNDMFGYLPTQRVQQEGGYEGGRATLWSALPAPLAETAEERVVGTVRRLVGHVRAPAAGAAH